MGNIKGKIQMPRLLPILWYNIRFWNEYIFLMNVTFFTSKSQGYVYVYINRQKNIEKSTSLHVFLSVLGSSRTNTCKTGGAHNPCLVMKCCAQPMECCIIIMLQDIFENCLKKIRFLLPLPAAVVPILSCTHTDMTQEEELQHFPFC